MKVFGALLVRNELDIIEANLRHHLPLIDRMLIMDHNSTDGTYQVIEEMAQRDPKILILRQTNPAYNQDEFVTEMALKAKEMGADWVLPIDADEFIVGDLLGALRSLHGWNDFSTLMLDCINFRATIKDPTSEIDPVKRMKYREHEANMQKVMVKTKDFVKMGFGNHSALFSPLGKFMNPLTVWIAHYPYRSFPQYASKIINGAKAYYQSSMYQNDKKGPWAYHWREPYELFQKGGLAELGNIWKRDLLVNEDRTKGLIHVNRWEERLL